jgi:hypothetical protein
MLINEDVLIYENSNHFGNYAWKLENVIKYEKPIFCKGQLGLWNFDME